MKNLNLSRLVTSSHAGQNVTRLNLSRLVTPPLKGRDNVTKPDEVTDD